VAFVRHFLFRLAATLSFFTFCFKITHTKATPFCQSTLAKELLFIETNEIEAVEESGMRLNEREESHG
jgi:hypothetical protein